jgi:transitional endoplasmic reticulum ATPase
MHSLSTRREQVNLLYVKSITAVYDIGMIFNVARAYSPCLLILEDIDSLVSGGAQSYFFNEVDGLANNDGIMMIATTNHLEKLDGGLANRPSRFDRKYNFPLPSYEERILYSEFWRKKLQDKQGVDFPKVLSPEIAKITEDFSFAYMKEAFIATLLAMARGTSNNAAKDDKDIDDLPFWKEMQKEVKILRDEMCAEQQAVLVNSLLKQPRSSLPHDSTRSRHLATTKTLKPVLNSRCRIGPGRASPAMHLPSRQ